MKSLKALVLLSTLFAGSLLAQNTGTPADLMPMQIGNKWQYWDGGGLGWSLITEIIGDTLMPNGEKYQVFGGGASPFTFASGYFGYSTLLRIDSTTYNLYSYSGNNCASRNYETLIDSLGMIGIGSYAMWDSCSNVLPYSNMLASGYDSLLINAPYIVGTGNPILIKQLVHDGLVYFSIFYAYGIGRVGSSGEFGTFIDISAALINGVQYGTFVTTVLEIPKPDDFILLKNYPNPFNPKTTFLFNLPTVEKRATLTIYNLLGKEVKNWDLPNLEKGTHTIEWNAQNQPSGIYFYQLKTGSQTTTKKLTLIK